jgi:sulfur relay (sulfurtransferase) DsrC/TusE family protein
MSSLTVNLSDIDELKLALTIIQTQIDKSEAETKQWEIERKQRKKKKTVEQIIEEIEEDIKYERDSIIDSNIEIENLELKREELEKHEKLFEESPAIRAIVKAIAKKKPQKKVKTDTELIPETD